MRPPIAPGEHMSRTVMTTSQQAGRTDTEQGPVTTHQMTSVYEVNYTQRASSVPRGVRHLERHVEVATEPSLEEHRADEAQLTRSQGPSALRRPGQLPKSLHKTRSEGSGSKYLPHPPRFLTKLPETITVQPNEKLMLSVDVTAIPTADFQWNVNGFEVKAGKNVQLLNEQNRSTLVMNPPVKQGKYNVTARNDEGRDVLVTRVTQIVTETVEEIHSEISIEVAPGPDIVESAVTVTSAHEDQWEMVDDGSNNSTTSFETVLKAREVSREENAPTPIVEEPSSEMTIHLPGERSPQTVDVVTSYSKVGAVTRVAEDMPKRPVFTQPPIQHIHVEKGEHLVLDSIVESVPPSSFSWFVNNFEVKHGDYILIEQLAPNHSRATFLVPAPGHYKVIATNPHGQSGSVTRVTTEIVEEEFVEKTTVTTTSTTKPVMFRLTRKSAQGRSDLPKAPTILEKFAPTLRIVDGQPLNLKVTADAIPPAIFTWLLNNFEVKNSQSSQITHGENCSEVRFTKAAAGKYEVIARNDRGQDSCACKVILEYADGEAQDRVQQQPPVFIQSLPSTVTLSGEELRLVVTVSGLPPINFRWFLNLTQLVSDPSTGLEIVIEGNRSILIWKDPAIQDAAHIIVHAENGHGVTLSETQLIVPQTQVEAEKPQSVVEPPPKFLKPLEDVELEPGSEVIFEVLVAETSEPVNFQWSLEDQILLNEVNDVEILSTSHASGVYIPKLEFLGTKQITVIAQNSKGTSVSTALLTVCGREEPFEMVPPDIPEECAPKILEPLHSTSFLDGQSMVLRCRIHANPSAAVIWSKDDVDVEEWVINKDVTTQVLPGGICELLNPECYPEDSGLYKCHATNPHGTAETSAYISVEGISYQKDREEASMSESCASMLEGSESIILPPKFVENLFAETDGVKELNYIRLVCRVISRADTTYTWWKDDVEIQSSEKYEIYQFEDGTQILTVHAPGERDNGVYTCKAESEHGLGSSSCEVIVPPESSPESIEMIEEMDAKAIESEPEFIEEPTVDFEICLDVGQQTTESVEPKEDITELRKEEEEFKLLVKVADSVASALVANVFVDAVREAARKIAEESSEEEDFESAIDGGSVPRFDTHVEEYVAVEGSPTRISTNVSGYPTPFVEWYFKDEKLKISESLSMSYGQGIASLNIQKVTMDHEGTYYCHATNMHGTSVLSTKLKVVRKPSAMDVRHTMSSYKKLEADEKVDTNVFAHSVESNLGLEANIVEKLYETNEATVLVEDEVAKKMDEKPTEEVTANVVLPSETERKPAKPEEARMEQISQKEEKVTQPETQTPQKAEKKERTPTKKPEVDPILQKIAEKFAESFTERVMDQVQNIVITTSSHKETTESQLIVTPVTIEREDESGRRSVTMPYEEKLRVIEDRLQAAASPDLTAEEAVNMVMNTVIQMKEQHIADHLTTVDVRQPNSQFDHVVTVVEPEVLQMNIRVAAPSATQLKFIDMDTILQKPGTSSDADLMLSAPAKKYANAEHRIVVLEGVSQNFQDAMTWSLKKVKRLASDGEASTNAQIEVTRPTDARAQASTTVVDAERIIPELLQVAAAASKLKLENVTVSLVRQGDSSHQQLVIEYESQVEDEADLNLAHIQYERQNESKSEVWSRRSRYSDDEDLGVVAVFVEVDAVCPDQSVEIVATVNAPLELKAESQERSTEDVLEVSQSVTESSIGLQPPKFFRKLVDSTSVVGNPAQFKCMVSGTPMPQIVWSVDGDVIQSNNEYELVYEDGVAILRINSCLMEDEGEYSCEAHNDAGTVTTKCFLRVLDARPDEPVPSEALELQEVVEPMKSQVLTPPMVDQSEVKASDSFAFYKYFETGSISVKITDICQDEYEEASFVAAPVEQRKASVSEASATSATDIFFMNTRKNSWAVAATRKLPGQLSFESTNLNLEAEKVKEMFSSTEELWDDDNFNNPFGDTHLPKSEEKPEEQLYEPRTLLLPQKMSYKGQEIAVRVNEMSMKETTVAQDGSVEVKEKTCKETELHFGAPVKEKKISSSEVVRINERSLPPAPTIEEYDREPRRVKTTQSSNDVLLGHELSPRTLKERERFDFAQVYTKLENQRKREQKKSPSVENVAKPIDDAISAIEEMLRESMDQQSLIESEVREIEKSSKKAQESEPAAHAVKEVKEEMPEIEQLIEAEESVVVQSIDANSMTDELQKSHDVEQSVASESVVVEVGKEANVLKEPGREASPQKQPPQDFASKIKELERIARKVEAELTSLSRNADLELNEELSGDAKEIEQAILKMSDQILLQAPVTKAQAEASEELMRTTLADMILNPTRTAEEEIELLKRPIRLLRDKISDIENSLMEDVEVENINETPVSPSTDTPTTVLTPLRQRVPSVELMRMTPLTTNIKDQLTSLEELITDHLESDEEGADTPTKEKIEQKHKKKRELHKIFTQINEEINTIKKFCSKKLTKRGSEAVENVLHKVRAHVTSIVNVITLAKRRATPVNNCIQLDAAMSKPEQEEKIKGIMVFKRSSIMDQSSTPVSTQISTILTSAGSESDETWRFSTELKTSASDARCSGESTPILVSTTETPIMLETKQHPQLLEPVPPPRRSRMPSGDIATPVAPPRKKRTSSADPGSRERTQEAAEVVPDEVHSEKPVAPPRTKRRTASLDARKQYQIVKDKFFTLPHMKKSKDEPKQYQTRSEDEQPVTEQGQSSSDWDYAPPVPPHGEVPKEEAPLPQPPTKPRRSFTGNALDILRHFNLSNPFAKKDKQSSGEEAEPLVPYSQLEDEEEKSEMDLLEELRSFSTSEHAPVKDATLEEDSELRMEEITTPVPNEVPEYQEQKVQKLPEESISAGTVLSKGFTMESAEIVIPILNLIEDEESQALSEAAPPAQQEPQPYSVDEVDAQLALTSSSHGFAAETSMTTENKVPVCHRMTVDYLVPADDTNSVQMLCEESDYATDTENSCMVKGTVQFFNRSSPLDQKQRLSWLGPPKRQSYLSDIVVTEDADENVEDVELDVVLQQVDGFDDKSDETSFAFNEVIVYESDLDSRSEVLDHPQLLTSHPFQGAPGTQLSTILEVSTETVKTKSDPIGPQGPPSADTSNIVMEETLLSQMASSIATHKTDDTDRNISSLLALRERDILSDESVTTEIEKPEPEPVESTTRFELRRHSERRKVIAEIYQDVRYCIGAVIAADNSFDVEINQEPENCGLVIKVIEDQVDFTSLTIIVDGKDETEDSIARDIPRQVFDDFTETSSFDEYEPEEGNEKAGITVSIIARSLHDGIYASLEEIPWGEVRMTVQEPNLMTKSLDNSVHFNVTVSESTADEKRSLRSQPSFKESQNSLSETENTLSSTTTANIPSYIIKLGSTATITCELNNYLPPNSDIHWYKGKKPLDVDPGRIDRISHDLLEVLVINSVDLDDNALYSLKVNEDIFPVAYLIIDDEPENGVQEPAILTPPQTQFVMDGQPTELSVQVNCDPSFVHWLKDKKTLDADSTRIRCSFSEDGWSRLVFATTRISDQGTYLAVLGDLAVTVTLVVEERIDEREVNVVASGTESEEDDVQEYLVPSGSTATIACELDESELQKSLAWLKNGTPIRFSGVDDKIEHVINGLKHYLVIHDTSISDTGLYSVRISNTEFRVAHLSINDMASPNQGLRRKRISSSSLHTKE